MPNILRIKRRASGSPGAPSSLANAELAYNEVDDILYYGKGSGGAGGAATTVEAIGGAGAYAKLASPALTGAPTAPTAAANTSTTQIATTAFVLGQANSTAGTITVNGTGAAGSSNLYARADHVHPTDTTRAALASPTFTGTPAAPTAAVDTNTTQLATTAFVVGQAASTTPAMDGTAAVGTSLRYARADHVHASDTTRAPLASPTFTGTPAAPTAAVDTNTTQIATTAYVVGQGYLKSSTATSTYAPLASPALTGTPTAPTATNGTNTTQIATTAFVRATRLDQLASPTAAVSMGSQRITSLADPTGAQDAATKNYVDNAITGLDAKASVHVATTGNVTLSGGAPNVLDGVTLVVGDRILVKNQTAAAQNGIYVVSTLGTGSNGTWTRATDMDSWAEVPGAYVFVEEGSTHIDQGWVCTADQGGTLGTTAINWTQFNGSGGTTYSAGNGLSLTSNTFSVALDGSTLSVSGTGLRINSAYLGQTSIDTVGTLTAGTWNATTIGVGYGGTGVTTLTGLVKGNGTSAFSAAVAGTDYHDTSSTIDGGAF